MLVLLALLLVLVELCSTFTTLRVKCSVAVSVSGRACIAFARLRANARHLSPPRAVVFGALFCRDWCYLWLFVDRFIGGSRGYPIAQEHSSIFLINTALLAFYYTINLDDF